MTKKTSIKKAIESISSGDARGLRKHINEALVEKVKKALDNREKQLARNLIESIDTQHDVQEATLSPDQVKKKMAEIKAIDATLDKLFQTDIKAYGAALKKAVKLSDELVAAGVNPNTGGKKGVPTM
jgi:hypothetical protein